MKKAKSILCVFLSSLLLLATACGSTASSSAQQSTAQNASQGSTNAEPVVVESLKIAYVPSMDAQTIIDSTEPLKAILIEEMAKHGFDIKKVEITVGTSFEAVGESLASGSVDVGIVGASVYVTFEDEVDLLLTATRDGFKNESPDPKVWNEGKPERVEGVPVTGYRGLILAGPSTYGQELAAKVDKGEELTWEDLDKAVWAVANTTSNAGYLYPCLWLKNNYGKVISDLTNVIPGTNYPTMMTQAASEQIDVFVVFADGRLDYEEAWNSEMGRKDSIFDDVKVIGVTDMIMNDVTMLTKRNAEVVEDINTGVLESLDAAGCTTFQKVRYGILPQLYSNFVSNTIYRFDINMKNAAVLGLVGAGGIGAPLIFNMNAYKWNAVGALLIGLMVMVLIIEYISMKIRVKLARG